MSKKTRIITSIDPAHNGDKSIITTAAVKRDGSVYILNMEEVPPPVMHVDWLEFKGKLERQELKFSQSAIESLKEWPEPHYVAPLNPKQRPPSTHKRVFKKGRRIMTIAALYKHLSSGGWIFWGHQKRAVHPGWVMSWQFQMVKNSLTSWGIWKAVRI